MAEFKIPSFLENQSVDDIHGRMMENLPSDIDTSEGGHPWNLTMPHAYEKAFMVEYIMTEAIKLIFPQFAEGYPDIMEYHAAMRGMSRKSAEYATGSLLITGDADTEIPIGSVFSTISINGQPSIDFVTTEAVVIGQDGTVTVPIRASLAGAIGNVAANTIVLNASSIDTISTITNPEVTSGGIEEETVEDLQSRIVEFDATQDISYGGTPSDYKRWALSVNGTGSVVIVSPEDDTTPIKIILTDANGQPATQELCDEVYNYIMRPDDPYERLAPINDKIVVVAPDTMRMIISATIELAGGFTIEQARSAFLAAMRNYILEASDEGEIKYSKVGSILSGIEAVHDYKLLLVNGDTANIALTTAQVPSIAESDIILNIGTV